MRSDKSQDYGGLINVLDRGLCLPQWFYWSTGGVVNTQWTTENYFFYEVSSHFSLLLRVLQGWWSFYDMTNQSLESFLSRKPPQPKICARPSRYFLIYRVFVFIGQILFVYETYIATSRDFVADKYF